MALTKTLSYRGLPVELLEDIASRLDMPELALFRRLDRNCYHIGSQFYFQTATIGRNKRCAEDGFMNICKHPVFSTYVKQVQMDPITFWGVGTYRE